MVSRRSLASSLFAASFAAFGLLACSQERGAATLELWGEAYLEQEIPAADVADGWTIRFSRFLLAVREVTVGGSAAEGFPRVYAVTVPGRKPVARFADLEAGEHAVSFVVGPVDASASLGEGATQADLDALVAAGASVLVEGEASRGGVTKRFAWAFSTSTRYTDCKAEVDGREVVGVNVTGGGEDRAEITIHGDHLFYDDLEATTAAVRFDALAQADADGDGVVTLDELARRPLAALDPALGVYGTGSAPDVADLRAFVTALSRTLGHFRGEGECVVRNE